MCKIALRRCWIQILLFALFFFVSARGALELFLPKSAAFILQITMIVCVLLFFLYERGCSRVDETFTRFFGFALSFAVVAFLSGLLTTYRNEINTWPIYLGYNLFLITYIGIMLNLAGSKGTPLPFAKTVCIIGWIQLSFCVMDQIGILYLPGGSNYPVEHFRSGALTGSFLHYPLFMALLGFILLQSRKGYHFSAFVFLLAPFLVLGRSGVFIVFMTSLLLAAPGMTYKAKQIAMKFIQRWRARGLFVKLLPAILSIVLISYAAFYYSHVFEIANNRIFKPFDLEEQGNEGRVYTWLTVLREWSETNLFIGERTGTITNSTSAIYPGKSTIAESSVLQQMVNFGLIGTILFYILLIFPLFSIRKEHRYLRAVYVVALLQTTFYQSIEAIAFILPLTALPWISASLEIVEPKGEKEVKEALCVSGS